MQWRQLSRAFSGRRCSIVCVSYRLTARENQERVWPLDGQPCTDQFSFVTFLVRFLFVVVLFGLVATWIVSKYLIECQWRQLKLTGKRSLRPVKYVSEPAFIIDRVARFNAPERSQMLVLSRALVALKSSRHDSELCAVRLCPPGPVQSPAPVEYAARSLQNLADQLISWWPLIINSTTSKSQADSGICFRFPFSFRLCLWKSISFFFLSLPASLLLLLLFLLLLLRLISFNPLPPPKKKEKWNKNKKQR